MDTIYKISGLFALLANSCMGLFVYTRDKRNSLYSKFALFSLSIAFWASGSFFVNIISDGASALWSLRVSYAFGVFLPAFFVDFIQRLTGVSTRTLNNIVKLLYACSVLFCFAVFSPYFIENLKISELNLFRATYPGSIYHLFFLYFSIVVLFALSLLLAAIRNEQNPAKSLQLKYIFVSYLIGMIAGLEYFSSVYNLIRRPPIDDYILIVTFAIMTYAIVRHQLMDIEVIIRRTAVFAGLFVFVYGTFAAVTLISQKYFQNIIGWNSWVSVIPTALLISVSLKPLEAALTNATERFLFQRKYDYRDLLKTFTNEVLTLLDIQQLPAQTAAGLIRILKLESASILLYDKERKSYQQAASIGVKNAQLTFSDKNLLVEYLKAGNQPILKDKVADRMYDGSLKETFKSLNAQICFPIALHDELIGILALGMKKSGEEYTQEDKDILLTLARTEAIAISNARLFEELSRTQAEAAQREKMAVIGTLAAGINHEICNPLGIVRGQCELFLLNLRDGYYNNKTSEELLKISGEIMNKVIKETDRATSITKKLSSFAKPSRQTDFEDVYVEKEVEEVLGLIEHDLKLSNIDIQRDFPSGYPVIKADRKQIQEVLFNIIRNAAQAIEKKEGRIVVSGFADHDNAIIRIADNGAGIPKDKVEQIFHPFYTTKAPGKGTGLGLFIVKQVVERNKGAIEVESEEGVGTTFTLRFPTAAKLAAVA